MNTPAEHIYVSHPGKLSLWEFSSLLYGKGEVEQLCLELQNEHGANVNVILWACWLESENISLSCEALVDIMEIVEPVSQSTVSKIREVRDYLQSSGCFTRVQSRAILKQLLNAELTIEKVLLNRMQDFTRRFTDMLQDGEQKLSLQFYLQSLEVPGAQSLAEQLVGLAGTLYSENDIESV